MTMILTVEKEEVNEVNNLIATMQATAISTSLYQRESKKSTDSTSGFGNLILSLGAI